MEYVLEIDSELSLVIPHLDSAQTIFTLIEKDRAYLSEWLPWVNKTTSVTNTEENILERIETFKKKEKACFYAVYRNQYIGSVGFVEIDKEKGTGEIGYWLVSELQGQGLMTRYVNACIKYGFEELALSEILIKCAKKNYKSAAVPERLGFNLVEETGRVKNYHTFRLLKS